jgi:carboxymethylenebutenolidase
MSFMYATRQPALGAAAVYYGTPPRDSEALKKINCPVAGFYGGDDARVTGTVKGTEGAMKEAGKAYTPHVFEGAGHGFLRQQSGRDGANQKAAEEAWPETVALFKKNLK